MENRLGRGIKSNRGIRRAGRFVAELHPAEIKRAQGKLTAVNQLALQSYRPVLFRLTGSNGLWSQRLVMYILNTFAQPEKITHGQYGIRFEKFQE